MSQRPQPPPKPDVDKPGKEKSILPHFIPSSHQQLLLYLLTTALSTQLLLFQGCAHQKVYVGPIPTAYVPLSSPSSSSYSTRGIIHTPSVICLRVSLPIESHPTPTVSSKPA